MEDEQTLVRQIVQGNVRAYQVLVERYQRLVLHMVSRIVHEPTDLDDACQEVFIKVYQHLPDFHFESKLSTWIATIAYRTGINYVKKNRRGSPHDPLDRLTNSEAVSTLATPEDLMIHQDWRSFLHAQIDKLPVHYRTILTLYHLDELSYEEIGQVTALPEGTVKNYLFRARKLLKEALQQHKEREQWPRTN
ncbi:sigma-70 family RNA polymerase sigma factor [Spirosoma knui]